MKEIRLMNFRSYRDEQVIEDLSNVNMFIGPNAAGKSNVIEALRCLVKMLRGQEVLPFTEMVFDRNENSEIELSLCFILPSKDRSRMIDKLFAHSNDAKSVVGESSFLKTLTYSVAIKKNGVVREEIKTPNIESGEIVIIKRSEAGPNTLRESVDLDVKCKDISGLASIGTSLKGRGKETVGWRILSYQGLSRSEVTLVNDIKRLMNNWVFFDPNRQASPRMESGEEASLNPRGDNLTKFMNSIQSSNPRRFINVVDEIIKIVPSIKEVLAPLKQRQAIVTVEEEGLTTPTEVGNVSFGLMQILVMVVGIVTKKDNSVIFIEEPELHLHATSQRRLFKLIQREAKNKQFFLTTHSTIFTACDKHNSTYLFTKPHGATLVEKIQEPQELRIIKEVLGHRNTDLFGDECVVFIEGDSEEVAFPIIAISLGYRFIPKGIRLVNIKGSGKAEKIGEYLRYLKDSGIIAYVIADGNKRVKEKLHDWQREGLIEEGCWTMWGLEFEDCFSLEMIARAFNEWLKEEGVESQLTVDELEKERKEGVSIVKALEKILHSNNLPSLNKPALAEKLAHLSIADIEKKEHKETPPEKEIRKIVEMLESRGKVPS